MNLAQWSQSSIGYGRKLVNSGIAGARLAENQFLKEEFTPPHASECSREALATAVLGACLGLAAGSRENGLRSFVRSLAFGLIGGAIGFSAAVAWENRQFTASVASGAWKSIRRTRDEHWLEKNPINYA